MELGDILNTKKDEDYESSNFVSELGSSELVSIKSLHTPLDNVRSVSPTVTHFSEESQGSLETSHGDEDEEEFGSELYEYPDSSEENSNLGDLHAYSESQASNHASGEKTNSSDYSMDGTSHMDSVFFNGENAFDIANKNINSLSDSTPHNPKNPDLLLQRMKPINKLLPGASFQSVENGSASTITSLEVPSPNVSAISLESSRRNSSLAGSNMFVKAIEKEHSRIYGDSSILNNNLLGYDAAVNENARSQENKDTSSGLDLSTSDVIDLTSETNSPEHNSSYGSHFISSSLRIDEELGPQRSFGLKKDSILDEQSVNSSSALQENHAYDISELADETTTEEPELLDDDLRETKSKVLGEERNEQPDPIFAPKEYPTLEPPLPKNKEDLSNEHSTERIHLHSKPIKARNIRDSIALKKGSPETTTMSKSLVLSTQRYSPEQHPEPHPDFLRRALSSKKVSDVRKLAFLQQAHKLNKPLTNVTFSPIKTVKEYEIGSSPSRTTPHPKSVVKHRLNHGHQRNDYYGPAISDSPSPSPSPSLSYNRESSYYSKNARLNSPSPATNKYYNPDSSFSESSFASSYNTEWIDVDSEYPGEYRRRGSSANNGRSNSQHYEVSLEEEEDEQDDNMEFQVRGFHNDPSVPYTLSLYLQLLLNFFLSCIFIYFFYILVTTIRHDVDKKVEEYSSEILAEMAECSKQYLRNNCMPGRRVPALENTCISWERCMNRDPTVVGRARVSAETFSEIINSFIKPLTLKTWAVIGGLMVASFVFSNAAFAMFRSNQHSYFQGGHGSNVPPQGYPPPPPPPPFTPGAYPPHTMPYAGGYYTPMLRIPGTTGKKSTSRKYRRGAYVSPTEHKSVSQSERKRSSRRA